MKFFTLIFVSIVTVTSAWAQHDTIDNPGFESWTHTGGADAYDEPNDWNTINPLSSGLGILTAYQDSTTVHSGKYSIKLVTKSIVGQLAPGLVTTGNVNTNGPYGGAPVNSRPVTVSGWYQYAPVGHDSGSMAITLTKWNSAGDSTETIGAGTFYAGAAVSTWTPFTINIAYTSGATPDTSQLLFLSSASSSFQVNSTLWIDDVSYGYTSGINETESRPLFIYPNPATTEFTFDNQNVHASSLSLYAADGQLVKFYTLQDGTNTLPVAGLSAGAYFASTTGSDGIVYRSSLVINK